LKTEFYLLFIIISGLGTFFVYFYLPETKNIPLEEMARLFGDNDDIAVYADEIHVDHNTHELVIDEHGRAHGIHRVATEARVPHQKAVLETHPLEKDVGQEIESAGSSV
jgi:hypothetical protein